MRRLALVLGLVLTVGAWPAGSAATGSVTGPATGPIPAFEGDFNNDGFGDVAVGVPGEDAGSIVDAGAVAVSFGSTDGLTGAGSQLFTQNGGGGVAETGDGLGEAVTTGDFNDDGFTDVAAGAPGEDVGTARDAGAVNVLYGSAGGLTGAGAQQITQNTAGVPSSAERADLFGAALSAGDFNADGFTDLAVGVPFEVATTAGGAVTVLYGSAVGLTGTGSQLFTQDSTGVPGGAENGDAFGQALAAGDFDDDGAADLAIGAPGEDVFARVDAGLVNVLYGAAGIGLSGDGSQQFTQDSSDIPGSAEDADDFGFALAAGDEQNSQLGMRGPDRLAIGAPGEDVGAVVDAGAVTQLFGLHGSPLSGAGSQQYTQNSVGPGSSAEVGDAFGFSLAVGDFTGCTASFCEDPGFADLAIGVPGEDVGAKVDAGAVNAIYDDWPSVPAIPRPTLFTQIGPGAGAEPGDLFGYSLAAGLFTSTTVGLPLGLVVGVPGEDAGDLADVGAITTLHGVGDAGGEDGGGGGLRSDAVLLYQNSPDVPSSAEAGDVFGLAVSVHFS